MATLASTLKMRDQMSRPISSIIKTTETLVNAFEASDRASKTMVNTTAIAKARVSIGQAKAEMAEVAKTTSKSRTEQERYNRSVASGTQAVGGLGSGLKRIFAMAGGGYLLSKMFSLDGAFDRMDTMTTFDRTMTAMTGNAQLSKAALESLKETTIGTAYGLDVASAAAQGFVTRGIGLGGATNEVRKWSDAVSFYGKGTNEALSNVMDAWQNMVSTRKINMIQLKRVMMEGVPVIEIYAQATKKSTDQVSADIAKGKIQTVEFMRTVSDAWDTGANGVLNISGKAHEAGATWQATLDNMSAAMTRGLVNFIENIDNAMVAAGFKDTKAQITEVGATVESVMTRAGLYVGQIVVGIGRGIQWISGVWDKFKWVIFAVVGALLIYKGIALLTAGITTIMSVAMGVGEAVMFLYTAATAAASAGQSAFNAVLYACPIVWIIAAILLVIGALFALAVWLTNTGGQFEDTFGRIVGVVWSAGAIIRNVFATLWNMVLGDLNFLWNIFASFAEFFSNIFNDPVTAIKNLFVDLLDSILGVVETAANAIDTLLGSNLASAVSGWREKLQASVEVQNAVTVKRDIFDNYKMDHRSVKDAYRTGYDKGVDLKNKFKVPGEQYGPKTVSGLNPNDYGNQSPAKQTAANTKKIADAVSSSEEDIKLLKDIAERDVINRFTTAEIKVDMKNDMTINNEMDIDGVARKLAGDLEKTLASTASGV